MVVKRVTLHKSDKNDEIISQIMEKKSEIIKSRSINYNILDHLMDI